MDLYAFFGPQGWWPADSDFEVMVGAVLTQNMSWRNVEKAISKLKTEGLMNPEAILETDRETLHECIRATGFYRQKTERLKILSERVIREGGVERFLKHPDIRGELLKVKGIGPETADSITLYAAGVPSFVVDAYTRRILERYIGVCGGYHEIRSFFHDELPRDVSLYREFHALLVRLAKEYCGKKPLCSGCPVARDCTRANRTSTSSNGVCLS